MDKEMIRSIAFEHQFKEIPCESEGWISFVKDRSHGRIRINFWEQAQIVLLVITKNLKGFKNYRKAFPSHKFDLVYRIFHNPNQFKKDGNK